MFKFQLESFAKLIKRPNTHRCHFAKCCAFSIGNPIGWKDRASKSYRRFNNLCQMNRFAHSILGYRREGNAGKTLNCFLRVISAVKAVKNGCQRHAVLPSGHPSKCTNGTRCVLTSVIGRETGWRSWNEHHLGFFRRISIVQLVFIQHLVELKSSLPHSLRWWKQKL